MLIKINGEEMDVAEGSSIQDVIAETNAPYTPGSIVCLIKGKRNLKRISTSIKLKQTRVLSLSNWTNPKRRSLWLMSGKVNMRISSI